MQFRPAIASVQDEARLPALKAKLTQLGMPPSEWPELGAGQDGVIACATEKDADVVVTGIVGCAGLIPTVEAIKVSPPSLPPSLPPSFPCLSG
jgi:1-deoxy-D-xylulose-5-phosphate reductoisomerase